MVIDAHLLILNEPKKWVEECLLSVATAPINLHILPGVPRNLGLARANGYSIGTAPFVTFIDADDTYNPEAFQVLLDALQSNPEAPMAYTNEVLITSYGKELRTSDLTYNKTKHLTNPGHVHGLMLMRRHLVLPHLAKLRTIKQFADWQLTLELTREHPPIHVPIIGRYWRQHPNQAHKITHA